MYLSTYFSILNYSISNTEDFSCIPYIYGCIDSTAYNYDISANTDNGSCQYCDLSVSLFVIVVWIKNKNVYLNINF